MPNFHSATEKTYSNFHRALLNRPILDAGINKNIQLKISLFIYNRIIDLELIAKLLQKLYRSNKTRINEQKNNIIKLFCGLMLIY